MLRVVFLLILLLLQNIFAQTLLASSDVKKPLQENWEFDGMLGKFNRQSIQRGFKVYKEVCAACHGVKRVSFRNLLEIGFSEQEVKSLAGQYEVEDGPNDEGEMFQRPATTADHIPSTFRNEQAARAANNGAYPLDLSLIIKARPDGANYIYSLLTGYQTPPHDFKLSEGMYYNSYFAGGGEQLAMPPPLTEDGQVTFDDGTKATVRQMAWDVVNFLQWVAEPEMEESKSLGIKVMLFFLIAAVAFYLAMKSIWRRVK